MRNYIYKIYLYSKIFNELFETNNDEIEEIKKVKYIEEKKLNNTLVLIKKISIYLCKYVDYLLINSRYIYIIMDLSL